MSPSNEEFSDSESDDGFNEDFEALRRACQLTGKSPTGLELQPAAANGGAGAGASSEAESDGEGEDDLQLVQCIQKRFAPMNMEDEPLNMKPLCTLPPDWSDSDDCGDDYEALRAIQRRFAAYNDGGLNDNAKDSLQRPVQVGPTIIDSEKESSNNFVERTNVREGFLNCVDTSEPGRKVEACDDAGGRRPSDLVEWDGPGDDDVAGLPLKTSHFPKSALAFVDAIKKNRSCQKFIRSKMMQMEARIEELNKLIERVKILKDFQVVCKRRTGRALSQKKDARVQLISVPKLRANMKLNEKKIPALYKGPPENSQVANYKEAMETLAVPLNREKWSKVERENLVRGVKQQFQGMLLQRSVDLLSEADGSYGSGNVDSIIESIKDIDITPEKLRLFVPKVNWEQLAAMYVPGRSGAECQARFLNYEDPLINHNQWTTEEDKNLLHIVQQKGLSDWIDIAASLGSNRTPFQCLARYQRSLNASILKREWTNEEDHQLRSAVETYGESNWQVVASMMEGRTGTQCSNRWLKTLHPTRKRVGKWTADEDKRLKVAVTLFGPKTWKKIAGFVPGRTQVQCRERWVNCLDPSLRMTEWTEEEDLKLENAIAEHGYCWSKVAACIPHRTDNQCWRRWKALFPSEVPLLQTARKIQKTALISNFVDRESERPALGPNDFRVPETDRITGSGSLDPSRRKRTRSRRRKAHEKIDEDDHSSEISSEVLRLTNGSKPENLLRISTHSKGRGKSSCPIRSNADPSSDSHVSACPYSLLPEMSNREEETINSPGNDGSIKRTSQSKRNRSGSKSECLDATNTSVAVLAIEPHPKGYEYCDQIEECSNLEEVQMGPEHSGDDATQSRKASKLQPRRRREKPEEMPESLSKENILAVTQEKMEKKNKKQTSPTNDDHPSSSDTRPLVDSREATEASPKIKAKKRKRKINEKLMALSETDDDSITHPLELQKSGSDKAHLASAKSGSSQREIKKRSQVCIGSSANDNVSVTNQPKRQRIRLGNHTVEVEARDDMTLAHFLQQIRLGKK